MASTISPSRGAAPRPPAEPSKTEQFVQAEIQRARQRVRLSELGKAGLVCLIVVAGYSVVLAYLDRWFEFSSFTRQLLFAGCSMGLAAYVAYAIVWPFGQRINPYYAARLVEQNLEADKNSLVNWLDLHEQPLVPAFRTAITNQAARDLDKVDLDQAIAARPNVYVLSAGGIMLVLLLLLFAASPRQFLSLMKRAWAPFTEVTIATRTRLTLIEPPEGDLTVAIGKAVTIEVQVDGRIPDQHKPDSLRVLHRVGPADPFETRLLESTEDSRRWRTTFLATEVKNGFGYQVAGGDAVTPEYRVTVRSNPLLTNVDVIYRYRSYLHWPDRAAQDPNLKDLRGTEVTLTAHTNRQVRDGRLLIEGQKPIQGEVSRDDPEALRFRLTLDQDTQYRVFFTSVEGETNRDPIAYTIQVLADQSPVVVLTSPGRDVEIGVNEVLPLQGQASDDLGLATLTLRMKKEDGKLLEPMPYRSGKSLLRGDGRPPQILEYQEHVDLAKLREMGGADYKPQPGQTIEYWLEAADFCDYPAPNVGSSKHYKIAFRAPVEPQKQQKEREQAAKDQQAHENQQDQKLQEQKDQQSGEKPTEDNQKGNQSGQQSKDKNGQSGDQQKDKGEGSGDQQKDDAGQGNDKQKRQGGKPGAEDEGGGQGASQQKDQGSPSGGQQKDKNDQGSGQPKEQGAGGQQKPDGDQQKDKHDQAAGQQKDKGSDSGGQQKTDGGQGGEPKKDQGGQSGDQRSEQGGESGNQQKSQTDKDKLDEQLKKLQQALDKTQKGSDRNPQNQEEKSGTSERPTGQGDNPGAQKENQQGDRRQQNAAQNNSEKPGANADPKSTGDKSPREKDGASGQAANQNSEKKDGSSGGANGDSKKQEEKTTTGEKSTNPNEPNKQPGAKEQSGAKESQGSGQKPNEKNDPAKQGESSGTNKESGSNPADKQDKPQTGSKGSQPEKQGGESKAADGSNKDKNPAKPGNANENEKTKQGEQGSKDPQTKDAATSDQKTDKGTQTGSEGERKAADAKQGGAGAERQKPGDAKKPEGAGEASSDKKTDQSQPNPAKESDPARGNDANTEKKSPGQEKTGQQKPDKSTDGSKEPGKNPEPGANKSGEGNKQDKPVTPDVKQAREALDKLQKDLQSSDAKTRAEAEKKLEEIRKLAQDPDVRKAAEAMKSAAEKEKQQGKPGDQSPQGQDSQSTDSKQGTSKDEKGGSQEKPASQGKTGDQSGSGNENKSQGDPQTPEGQNPLQPGSDAAKSKGPGKPGDANQPPHKGGLADGQGDRPDPPPAAPDTPDSKRFRNMANDLTLDKLKKNVNNDVLKEAKMTPEEYQQFLKAYENMIKNDRGQGGEKEKLPAPMRGGAAQPNRGLFQVESVANPKLSAESSGPALAPPEFRDAYNKFSRGLSALPAKGDKK